MLQWVHQLGTPQGVRALAVEALFRGEGFAGLPDEYGHPATALWCLIHCPPVFHHVLQLDAADSLPRRHWHHTPGQPAVPPDHSRDACLRLERAVGDYLRAEQGGGSG